MLGAGLSPRDRVYTINLEITGLCNAHCTYCHFYLKHERESVKFHMPMTQFEDYCRFIRYWSEHSGAQTNYRFSGGDPITMKDKLFDRARIAHDISGLRPFLLTHGRGLKQDWFDKARDSAFSAIYMSIENPVEPDSGAEDPERTIALVAANHSDDVPVKLGVCVVPNHRFGDLLEICDWFYERIGYIPPIAEVNYGAYVSPTEEQWAALERSLAQVLDKYYGRTHLNLFHSVSPELSYTGKDPYVFSLGLINRFGIDSGNIPDKAIEMAKVIRASNYPFLQCAQQCPWSDFCINTKWYWQGDDNNASEVKIRDYCRFKRILNDACYRQAVDPSHPKTICAISLH